MSEIENESSVWDTSVISDATNNPSTAVDTNASAVKGDSSAQELLTDALPSSPENHQKQGGLAGSHSPLAHKPQFATFTPLRSVVRKNIFFDPDVTSTPSGSIYSTAPERNDILFDENSIFSEESSSVADGRAALGNAMHNTINRVREENADLKKTVQAQREMIQKKEVIADTAIAEAEQAKRDLLELRQRPRDDNPEIEHWKTRYASSEQSCQELAQQKQSFDVSKSELELRLDRADFEICQKDRDLGKLQEELKKCQNELVSNKSIIFKKNKSLNNLESEREDLEKRFNQVERMLESRTAELSKVQDALHNAVAENTLLKQQLDQSDKGFAKLNETERQLETKTREVNQLTGDLDKAKADLKSLRNESKEAKESFDKLEASSIEYCKEMAKLKSQIEIEKSAFEKETSKQTETIKELEKLLGCAKDDLEVSKIEISHLQSKNKELSEEERLSKKQVSDYDEKLASSRERIESLWSQNENKQNEIDRLAAELKETNIEHTKYMNESGLAQLELLRVKEAFDTEKKVLVKKLDLCTQDLQAKSAELDALKPEFVSLKDELTLAKLNEKQFARAKEVLGGENKGLLEQKTHLESKLEQLKNQFEVCEKKVSVLQRESQGYLSNYKASIEEIEALKAENSGLKADYEQDEEIVQAHEEQVSILKELVEELQEELEKNSKHYNELHSQAKHYEQELSQWNDDHAKNLKLIDDFKQKKNKEYESLYREFEIVIRLYKELYEGTGELLGLFSDQYEDGIPQSLVMNKEIHTMFGKVSGLFDEAKLDAVFGPIS